MKNLILFLAIFVSYHSQAQNTDCHYTMDIQGDLKEDSTYILKSVSFSGIKSNYHQKILSLLSVSYEQKLTLNLSFFESFLKHICQYKKYKISKVMIGGSKNEAQLLLVYAKN